MTITPEGEKALAVLLDQKNQRIRALEAELAQWQRYHESMTKKCAQEMARAEKAEANATELLRKLLAEREEHVRELEAKT